MRVLYDEFHAFHVRGVPSHLRVPEPDEVDEATFDRAIERLVEGDDTTLLVAETEGRLVGFAEVYVDPPTDSAYVVPRTTATLQSLLVTEGFRGTGVGRELMDAAERWAAERGVEELKAKTWEFSEGPLFFYEALGYQTLRRELVKSLERE
jgi:GNAT superfamily N-acetyltransferase